MSDAEEQAEEKEEGGKKRGGAPLLLILMLVNTLGLLGIGAYVVFLMPKAPPAMTPEQMAAQPAAEHKAGEKGGAEGHGEEKGGGEGHGEKAGPTMDLGTLTVNLREPSGEHFLRAKITLEIDAEPTKAEVESHLSEIRYQLNMLLSGQRVADVQGPEKMEALRQAMIRRANAVLSTGRITGVWPEEWIVQ
jgi:flagellar FliL protein